MPSIYSSASPMGRKSALRREIPWILRGFRSRASKLLICGPFQKGRVLAQDGELRITRSPMRPPRNPLTS